MRIALNWWYPIENDDGENWCGPDTEKAKNTQRRKYYYNQSASLAIQRKATEQVHFFYGWRWWNALAFRRLINNKLVEIERPMSLANSFATLQTTENSPANSQYHIWLRNDKQSKRQTKPASTNKKRAKHRNLIWNKETETSTMNDHNPWYNLLSTWFLSKKKKKSKI